MVQIKWTDKMLEDDIYAYLSMQDTLQNNLETYLFQMGPI